MIHKALEVIQIFLADGRANEGVPRGPRGPKKANNLAMTNKFGKLLGWTPRKKPFVVGSSIVIGIG